ncbi:hypothetical protein ACWD00_29480 [Streptomyces viridiviolaceus]
MGGRIRRRTGAMRWELYCDGEDADTYIVQFLMLSREEHLRRHSDADGAARG